MIWCIISLITNHYSSAEMQSVSPLEGNDCAAMNADTGDWKSYPCDTPLPYVCKKQVNDSQQDFPGESEMHCEFNLGLVFAAKMPNPYILVNKATSEPFQIFQMLAVMFTQHNVITILKLLSGFTVYFEAKGLV